MVSVGVSLRDQAREVPLVAMVHHRRGLIDDSISGGYHAVSQIAILAAQQLLVERPDLLED